MTSAPIPLWRFRVEADQLADGKYRVRVIGEKSGRVFERVGYRALWELIRIIGDPSGARQTDAQER